MFFKNLVLLLLDKVTTGTWSLALLVWNVALVVCVATLNSSGSAFGLTTLNVLDISAVT